MTTNTMKIAFQGELGAYSHQACREVFPGLGVVPCPSFEAAIQTVNDGKAGLAVLPVENSTYGRIADVHSLLPHSGLHIVGEHFVRVHISLLAVPGAVLSDVKQAMSLTVLLGQCRAFLKKHHIAPLNGPDTAGSAKMVAEKGDKHVAALASPLAGEIYGLTALADQIEDQSNNTTRFLIMSPKADRPAATGKVMTTFVFQVRNIPAALYKAMGGFATNGVNMVKLESYMLNGSFTATQFYADIEGHPDDAPVQRAMEELSYFTTQLEILGVYEMHPYRLAALQNLA